jgi:hypothetical protein
MTYTDVSSSSRSPILRLKTQIADCNRAIADLKGRLKERELIVIELVKLLREVMLEGDPRRPQGAE